jgi:hypothetical protein
MDSFTFFFFLFFFLLLRPLGSPRRRRVDSIKMDVQETGWSGVGWIDLAQDRDQ